VQVIDATVHTWGGPRGVVAALSRTMIQEEKLERGAGKVPEREEKQGSGER
jgi:hypothetical protein